MELIHEFTVPASIEDAWATFNDLERIAPCFPGAALTSYDGHDFAGLVKVKLGPISLQYNGTGRFVERDEASHRAVIEAKGKDKRGNGTAAANVTAVLEAAGEGQTNVKVSTDLNITGKPAQFGRGVMQDVSDKLLGQFATCLEEKLGQGPDQIEEDADMAAAAAVADQTGGESATAAKDQEASAADTDTDSTANQRAATTAARLSGSASSTTSPTSELDLGATVLPVLLKRYAPYILGGLLAFWLLKKIFRHS